MGIEKSLQLEKACMYIYIFTEKIGNLKEKESQSIEMRDPGNTRKSVGWKKQW